MHILTNSNATQCISNEKEKEKEKKIIARGKYSTGAKHIHTLILDDFILSIYTRMNGSKIMNERSKKTHTKCEWRQFK